ncbi:MAG: hypothetical protein RR415_11795 [Ruthenibacterium sp.]
MKFPSKVTPYKESVLVKFPVVLNLLQESNMTVPELYKKMKSRVSGASELVEILDCLYALGKIEIDDEGVLRYVTENDSL